MPMIGRAKVLRSWGGIMDMTPDGSPIIDKTAVDGLFIDCGWNYGGFKAVPASGWCMAHLMATGQSHDVARRFRLDRFRAGQILDEEGTDDYLNRPAPDAPIEAWDDHLHLRDNPAVEAVIEGRPKEPRIARIPNDAERAELWQRVTARYRNYAQYQTKTSRQIPLVILEKPAADKP
eukprot:gene8655-10668_t